jgi:hypothetical protein
MKRPVRPKAEKKFFVVNVRVDLPTLEALRAKAERENRTVSNLISTILREQLLEQPARDEGEGAR